MNYCVQMLRRGLCALPALVTCSCCCHHHSYFLQLARPNLAGRQRSGQHLWRAGGGCLSSAARMGRGMGGPALAATSRRLTLQLLLLHLSNKGESESFFQIGVYLVYSVILVAGVQHSDSTVPCVSHAPQERTGTFTQRPHQVASTRVEGDNGWKGLCGRGC